MRREQTRRFDLTAVQFECKMHTWKETRSRTEKFKSEFIYAELKTDGSKVEFRWKETRESQALGEVSINGPSLNGSRLNR